MAVEKVFMVITVLRKN